MPGSDPSLVTSTRYQRIAELGRGGMASVYLAALRGPREFQKLVVIKEMRPELASRDEFRDMFFAEARLAARLAHPNVVHTYEVVEDAPGVCSIVMEFLDGQPLGRVRNASSREVLLPIALYAISELLAGLEYLHELTDFDGTPLGLVHRDVSPQNVFLTYDGHVKLLDFGIAKANHSAETAVGTIKGKLAYMAPEQALGHRVDPRTDIFATGILLFEALVGRRMWKGCPEEEIPGRLATGMIPRIADAAPTVPSELVTICERALSVSPADRYQSASAFRKDLVAFLDTMPARPTRAELGRLVSSLFSEQRATLRHAIDASLAKKGKSMPLLTDPSASSSVAPFAATQILQSSSSLPRKASFGLLNAILAAALFGTIIGVVVVLRARRPDPPPAVAAAVVQPQSAMPPPPATSQVPAASPSAPTNVTDNATHDAAVRSDSGTKPSHFYPRPPPPSTAKPPPSTPTHKPGDPDLGY